MFTRGPGDLKNTAIFIGGSQVEAGSAPQEGHEAVLRTDPRLGDDGLERIEHDSSGGRAAARGISIRRRQRRSSSAGRACRTSGRPDPGQPRSHGPRLLPVQGPRKRPAPRSARWSSRARSRRAVWGRSCSPLWRELSSSLRPGRRGSSSSMKATWSRPKRAAGGDRSQRGRGWRGLGGIGITDKAVSKHGTIR